MTSAEVELAILVARGIVAAGSAIYEAIAGQEDPEELIARARRAGHDIPVRTGPQGTWDADLDERLGRGGGDARPRRERIPDNPYEDEDDGGE